MWRRRIFSLALAAAGVIGVAAGAAKSDPAGAASGSSKEDPRGEAVGLFEGMEAGKIEARLAPRNARRCRLFLTNKTDQPLSVQLPDAFAGVPVLAQFQNAPNDGGPRPNAPQPVGGPFPPGVGFPNQPGQRPGGFNVGDRPFMNLPPEKTLELKLSTVCLEHGKPDPTPSVRYELCPVEKATKAPGVAELLGLMGRSDVSRTVAQAAAWHLANGKTWDELGAMRTSRLVPTTPVFSKRDLEAARALADEAARLAQARSAPAPATRRHDTTSTDGHD
ncbi:MAG: hypothetical protein JW809_05615 [Pirellulales bacterium]|nr:hypothetical protein [Pirellulales bacterium]